ncbi:MAG TPA: hypothetical protein VMW43_03055 [Bacteroidota bacterium]|nr:hypothetical protein [Bacteroidota bacterium]
MEIIWLVVGACVMAGAFFFPGGNDDIWHSLDRAGIAAGIYIIVMLFVALRKPFGVRVRLFTWGTAVVTLLGLGLWWTTTSSMAHQQKDDLIQIRERLSRTILFHEMYPMFFPVLREYYAQNQPGKESIGAVFHRLYPNAEQGKNIRTPFNTTDSLTIFLTSLTDTAVVLVGQEMYVHGRDGDFRNYTDKTGMVQEKAILTVRGVSYVSEN